MSGTPIDLPAEKKQSYRSTQHVRAQTLGRKFNDQPERVRRS